MTQWKVEEVEEQSTQCFFTLQSIAHDRQFFVATCEHRDKERGIFCSLVIKIWMRSRLRQRDLSSAFRRSALSLPALIRSRTFLPGDALLDSVGAVGCPLVSLQTPFPLAFHGSQGSALFFGDVHCQKDLKWGSPLTEEEIRSPTPSVQWRATLFLDDFFTPSTNRVCEGWQ